MEKLSDKEWWALRRYSTAPLSEIWRDAIDIVLTHRPVSYTADHRAEITPLVRALRDIRMSLSLIHIFVDDGVMPFLELFIVKGFFCSWLGSGEAAGRWGGDWAGAGVADALAGFCATSTPLSSHPRIASAVMGSARSTTLSLNRPVRSLLDTALWSICTSKTMVNS